MRFLLCGIVLLAMAFGTPALATTFYDTVGDNFDGNAHMDITSVDVSDDGTNITFKISVNAASINSPSDWGKYVIGIDTGAGTGDFGSPVGNPWGRNINMAGGMDAWIGSWVDSGGGFQPFTYSGGSWTQNGQFVPVIASNMTTITTTLASLGLSAGQSFNFDVYTTGGGGGDSANDSLANPNQSISDWPGPYTTPAAGAAGGALTYAPVPEPASVLILGWAVAAAIGFGRRRK